MDPKNDKSKTIATIDVNINWLSESVEEHLNCVLCGEQLQFAHKTDFVEQVVLEDAKCPSCGVRTRQNNYRLQ